MKTKRKYSLQYSVFSINFDNNEGLQITIYINLSDFYKLNNHYSNKILKVFNIK